MRKQALHKLQVVIEENASATRAMHSDDADLTGRQWIGHADKIENPYSTAELVVLSPLELVVSEQLMAQEDGR